MDNMGLSTLRLARVTGAAMLLLPCIAAAADAAKARAAYAAANKQFDQGQFSPASDLYKSAIAEDPGLADAYHNLALATEMIDRKQAIEAWKRFLEAAEGKEEYKFDLARIRARVQILESMPALPDAMQPGRYDSEAGDYYWQISRNSEGEEWKKFPIKVFLGSAPQLKWQKGTRQAFDTWAALIPLQIVAVPQQADIRVNWESAYFEPGRPGFEEEWVNIKQEGEGFTARRIAVVSVDLSINWDEDDMRAIITHELGHALGIKGHSDSKKDIMFMELQRKVYRTRMGPFPIPLWKSLVKQPSQRDLNTLIRLYNHAGSSVRFR